MLSVGVAIRFAPSEVGQPEYQCLEEAPSRLEAVSATVCLTIHKSSTDQLGEFPPGDPGPQPPRPQSPRLQPYPQDRGALKPNLTCLSISAGVGNLGPFSPPLHPPSHCLSGGHPSSYSTWSSSQVCSCTFPSSS